MTRVHPEIITSNDDEIVAPEYKNMRDEVTFVLQIQQSLEKIIGSTKTKEAIEAALNGILYANTQSELNAHHKRIKAILATLQSLAKPNDTQAITALDDQIQALAAYRTLYLPSVPTFMQFLSSQRLTGLNLIALILPLLLSFFLTPLGIAILITTAILTAADIGDFIKKSSIYWDDSPDLRTRALTDTQIEALASKFDPNTVQYFTDKATKPSKPRAPIDSFLYTTYILAFMLSLIGLLGLAFPPLGIPAVALLVLTVLTIALAFYQGTSTYQQVQTEVEQIRTLENAIESDIQNDKQELLDYYKANECFEIPAENNRKTSWLNLRTWYPAPNSDKHTSISSWIKHMTQTLSALMQLTHQSEKIHPEEVPNPSTDNDDSEKIHPDEAPNSSTDNDDDDNDDDDDDDNGDDKTDAQPK